MATDVNIFGQVRGIVRQLFSTAQQQIQLPMGDGGELLLVQAMPERSELVKLGKSWGAVIPTGSAIAPVAAWPTTTPHMVMKNNEASGGPSYIIDRVWSTMITGGMTGPMCVLAQLQPPGITGSFTDNSAVLKHQLSGRATNYAGNAQFSLAAANVPIANQWFTLGQGAPLTAANAGGVTVGLTVEAQVQGRLILPPGAFLSFVLLGGQATGTAVLGLDWHEHYLNLA